MQCNYIMSLNMHHNNINTEYVKASAEALFNGTIAGGSHAGELILEWRNLKCWLRDWHISKTAGPPALTVTHCAKQQWHTWRPGLVGPDTAQEQQTRACAHIWISHICTARGHNQLTATSVASLSKQLADIKESIPPKDDAIPGQARQKASPVINRKYLSGCHKIRAHRCTDRLIVDKSRKNATTPISSLCRIPSMASLPSAPWSGRDLASASQTAHTDTKRSKREMQLAGILAATSLVPDRRPCVHISDFFSPLQTSLNGSEMLPTVWASPCFYCLRRSAGKRATFPSADLQWNSDPSALLWYQSGPFVDLESGGQSPCSNSDY